MRTRSVLALVCFFFSILSALAQTDRGTLTGTVSDATGAVVPGVSIEARNAQTGAVYQAGSSETGNYTLAQLPAGTYEVSGTLPGFRRFVRTGVIVSVATVLRIDVTLEVGASGESVPHDPSEHPSAPPRDRADSHPSGPGRRITVLERGAGRLR